MTTYPKAYDFDGWDDILGTRTTRKVENNTYVERLNADTISIKLHNTYIMEYRRDGSIIVRDGGYRTVTTRNRIDYFLERPWSLYQRKGYWYMTGRQAGSCLYQSGMDIKTL